MYAPQTEAGILTNLPLWSRRPNHRACSTQMPPSQCYKRRCVACQHSPDDQTLRLQTGAGEDDFIHLRSGYDRVDCERQEEEEESERRCPKKKKSLRGAEEESERHCPKKKKSLRDAARTDSRPRTAENPGSAALPG